MLLNIDYLLPEIFLSIVSVLLIGYGVVLSRIGSKLSQLKKMTNLTSFSFLLTALLLLDQISISGRVEISNGLLVTDQSIVFIKLILVISSAIILILPNQLKDYEFSQLVLLSLLGMMILISSNDLIMMYLGIELMSLSFYVLASINRNTQHSTEAGIKYFLLGALSSGLLLFGMALVYAYTGETNLEAISSIVWYANTPEIVIGALFISIALLFKLGAAPFHMWLPDVYEGSPTIVTAFFAIVPKISILFTLANLLSGPFLGIWETIQPLFIVCAILSLIVGAIGAINQGKIKRLISYSAISHVGFLLIGIIPLSFLSIQATLIYITLYIIMSLNTFTWLINFSQHNYISQFSGLSRSNIILALTFTFTLLSIAGIPPLAGFFSKYLVLINAIENQFYLLSFIAVITSAISTFYYLRLIKWIFFNDSSVYIYKDLGDTILPLKVKINSTSTYVLGFTIFLILTFMIFPESLTSWSYVALSSKLI